MTSTAVKYITLLRGTGMKQFWLLGRAGQSELGTSTRLGF